MLEPFINELKTGGVIAFPTETVYGLGADARNPDAVRQVFELKSRPADNPLIVHVGSALMAGEFAAELTEDARALMRAFWPGPLTLILPKRPEVLDIITGGLDTVALRWPSHPLAQELINAAGPLVAPSANKSGRPSPTKPEHVREDFGEEFPIVEGGETQIGLESTVLDLSRKPYAILRPGFIGREQIEEALGKKIGPPPGEGDTSHSGESPGNNTHSWGQDTSGPARSPGTKYSHYAPKAAVRWMESSEKPDPAAVGTLYLLHSGDAAAGDNIVNYAGDYDRMARELYDRFRQADHHGLATIAIQLFSANIRGNRPIVEAIANRISKAAGN